MTGTPGENDALSDVLRTVRLSGALQFCFMPSGSWQTDDKPRLATLASEAAPTIPFHILVEGECWLRIGGEESVLGTGDVVAFPHATAHVLGAGRGGQVVIPTLDLPPRPWRQLPVLRYGDGTTTVRLLCGYLTCEALNFGPLRAALPHLIHVRTAKDPRAAWLGATIGQIVEEVDRPRSGGLSMLERLTEITFIELLRHQIGAAATRAGSGWLAALADPALGRCLAHIHDDPRRSWSVGELARLSGLSRSTLAQRFEAVLHTSPMRYVREWRLYLASVALGTTRRPVAAIADEAGYGTEAAFSRAFSRTFGSPPAAWRQQARRAQA
ncbi:MAG: AraC family transcriptional regulator [Enhydrobacter sp.]|nr:MAG: AraC family transcriptional regulator [Enhydrobacter sp.]